MKTKHIFLFITSLFLSLSITAQKSIKTKTYTLNNGLTVILNPDATQNQVFGGVVVKAGSKHDPADHTGIAHYLEHMLFKGTDELGTSDFSKEKPLLDRISVLYDEISAAETEEARKAILKKINEISVEAGKYAIPTEFDKLVRSIGGSGLNAFTGDEITFYFNAFPSHQIEKWLHLYSHRFINPVFRLFQSELEVVYEEKNMYNDNFITGLFETFLANLYKNHPYGQQTTIGTTEHLKNPSLRRMYEFYHTYYVPNNMALVLAGNFDVEHVQPLIEEMFGVWEAKEIPEYPLFKEQSFNGRELTSVRLSPIKIGALGFRTVPNNHKDEFALDVCEKILSNNAQTGLLDKLALDNKLMFAGALPLGRNNDHGAAIILFIPKIIGQSLNKAEKLIIDELENLRKGNFDDALLEAVKNELYVDFVSSLENLQMRTVYLAQAFTQDKDIEKFLAYPEIIRRITKEDVVRVAEKYFNNNYLALHSKMGFPKKEKLDKPGFDPIKPDENAVSPYATNFYEMHGGEGQLSLISFENDIETIDIAPKVKLYYTSNPVNDIYTMRYKIGIGSFEKPVLAHAAQIMNYAGTDNKSLNELKSAFHNIGSTYSISCNHSYITIELQGLEHHFDQAVRLIAELLSKPVIEKDKIKLIYNEERTARRLEDKEPADVARALVQYVRKGNKSDFLNRLTLRQIKRLKAQDLVNEFMSALLYASEIHYSGNLYPSGKVAALLAEQIIAGKELKDSKSPVHIEDNDITQNTIYFVNDKKAIQSQIYFLAKGEAFNVKEAAFYDAFNEYFGGGFSGLVVQEIREYRSMAYATGAVLRQPLLAGKPSFFTGYIGTQADKTNEALDVFMELFRNMPVKDDRIDVLRASLTEELYGSRPNFRNLSENIVAWQHQGFEDDPGKYKYETFKGLSFDEIVTFHERTLKNKPVAICIVGDKKKLDMAHIAKYGKIVEINKKALYSK